MIYLIMWNEGLVDIKAVKNECEEEGWVPVLSYRPASNPETPPAIIAFRTGEMAHQFTKRNVTKAQIKAGFYRGSVQASEKTVEWIKAQGWTVDLKEWGNKMVGDPQWILEAKIIEMQESRENRGTRISHAGVESLRPI